MLSRSRALVARVGGACQKGRKKPMAEERRFPCPYCGAEFHFTQHETRLSGPCAKCGHYLVLPHGQLGMNNATGGAVPELCHEARKAVYWAMWPLPSKSLILDGKRYKALVRGQEIRVTWVPEKKPKGGS
jgi:ribosomal protein S27AE